MIKTVLIEDESYIRKGLIAMIGSFENELEIIGECATVKDGIVVAKACCPDLIFLDVNLSDGNAFDFIAATEMLDYKVVFITAYKEYAIQALKKGAVDYILKPVDLDELKLAIEKVNKLTPALQKSQIDIAKAELIEDNEKLVLNFQNSVQVIYFKELIYCESNKGYTTFFLENGDSYLASKTLKFFENKIPHNLFFRTHQSYFVNLSHIRKYDKRGLAILKNGIKIPVSVRRRELFVAELMKNKSYASIN